MLFHELVNVGAKTTMRIGGQARYFAELKIKTDVEEATRFAAENNVPLVILGGGSNTVFADGVIEALVVRMKNSTLAVEGNRVTIGAGVILGSLLNDLAKKNLDLSALAGIPGTLGGAIFGNAGQGPESIWIGSFVESVTFFHEGVWKTFTHDQCAFAYRESAFKRMKGNVIVWEAVLRVPSRPAADVQAAIEQLLQKRIATQPHLKTAGSCFKAAGGTPAWKLIDTAGLRGLTVGDVQVAEKHANFLLNTGRATFTDAVSIVKKIQETVKEPLDVEMRFIDTNGSIVF